MNHRTVSLALVAVVLASTPVMAQPAQAASGEVRVTDPSGDVRLAQGGQNVTTMPGTHPHLDLRAAWIGNETEDDFEVGYGLQRWEDPFAGADMTARFVSVGFEFGERAYMVTHGPILGESRCPRTQAAFATGNPDEGPGPARIACLNVTIDPPTATARIIVPKGLIKSATFLLPQVGDSLTDLVAVSRQLAGFGFATDRAPDAGNGGPFILRKGAVERTGDLVLQSAVPVRASNGESTTMVFRVRLANQGDVEHVAALMAVEDNPEWTVRLPQRLRVPAESYVEFPVILSMNFTHQHGVTEFLEVRADSVGKPGHSASVELGVHWLEIPQPAGHHDRLWLHSAPGTAGALGVPPSVSGLRTIWMNPVEKDPNPGATDDEVGGFATFPVTTSTEIRWNAPLLPALQIGLDVDETRTGLLETKIRSSVPASRAVLQAAVYYCNSGAGVPGASDPLCGQGSRIDLLAGVSAATSLAANAESSFALELKPNETAGILPYEPGRNIALKLLLKADTPQGVLLLYRPPTVVLFPKSSSLLLPLLEYHDPVDQSFENVGSIQLDALDPFEKPVNPGRRVLFRFDVTNVGREAQDLRLAVEGINAIWASVLEGAALRLEPQEKRQATVVVEVPEDAQPGERAELFFAAESTRDPSVVTLARIRATVVALETQEVPDETPAAVALEGAGTPSPPVLAVMILMWATVLLKFRERRRS